VRDVRGFVKDKSLAFRLDIFDATIYIKILPQVLLYNLYHLEKYEKIC